MLPDLRAFGVSTPQLRREQIDMLEKVLVLAEENEKKPIPIRLFLCYDCYDKVILDR
ncbi:MAG: hypothetical protein HFH75_15760 [Lachnospiraceae bacterium]|jgi:hypothetical protein|nr:hypothetical protein [Lachnospiraceae bacterium]